MAVQSNFPYVNPYAYGVPNNSMQPPPMPPFNPYTPQGANPAMPNVPFDVEKLKGARLDQWRGMVEMYLGLNQYNQQNNQWAADFNEAARRWQQEMQWRQQSDLYSQNLAAKQFGLADWQARQQAQQFGQQLGFQREQFGQQFGLQQRQFEEGQRQFGQELGWRQNQFGQQLGWEQNRFGQELGENRRQFDVGQANEMQWRKTQEQLQREQQANQLTQSRYAAFGRAQAPSARMARSW